MASMMETVLKWRKVLLAWPPSWTQAPRALGMALPVMRITGGGAHRR
jgi:hypothetical protein